MFGFESGGENEKKFNDGKEQIKEEKESQDSAYEVALEKLKSPEWINKVKENQEKAKPSATESTETKKENPKPKQEKPEEAKKKAPESPEGEPSPAKETTNQSTDKKTSQIPSVGPAISRAFEKGAKKAESGGGSKEK